MMGQKIALIFFETIIFAIWASFSIGAAIGPAYSREIVKCLISFLKN